MADETRLEIGDNLRAVLIALLAVLPVIVGQIWSVTAANGARRASEDNAARIGSVEADVRAGRNEQRARFGLPPVEKTDL
jgi:hypothetical protein